MAEVKEIKKLSNDSTGFAAARGARAVQKILVEIVARKRVSILESVKSVDESPPSPSIFWKSNVDIYAFPSAEPWNLQRGVTGDDPRSRIFFRIPRIDQAALF